MSAMPKGEFSPSSSTLRVSAMPSWSASRKSVMRFALTVLAPARFIAAPVAHALMPPEASSGLGGALVSATSTSPLGSTYSQRGWSSPPAYAVTARPLAATGCAPGGQPTARAVFTVGMRVVLGGGNLGFGPMPASTGSVATSPQALSITSARPAASEIRRMCMMRLQSYLSVPSYSRGRPGAHAGQACGLISPA
ncbi:hypothetical protein D3C86_1214240 [compost metagenome]